jgi:peptide chain release factor 2
MTIKPGAGGVESCDWAEMLFRMYTGHCRRMGWSCEVMEMLPGEVAGLKACTLEIKGENAYGYLKSEMGTHRLVRISPFDANARRQTSFAAVEVTPELDDLGDVQIDEKDLKIDTYKASGAGGQHVNKTESAIRLTHVPTGVVVSCQTQRSQMQNRLQAMNMLAAKLQQLKEVERLDELKDLKGERGTIGWGHQIRSYVMMPYQMVKDLRTGHESSQIQNVLDGDLQPFCESYLRWVLAGRPDRKAAAAD